MNIHYASAAIPSPGVQHFKINDNAAYTNESYVDLWSDPVFLTGAIYMRFSNDEIDQTNLLEPSWDSYESEKNDWPLSQGDGIKTVYAEFSTDKTQVMPSTAVLHDSITLDTHEPVLVLTGSVLDSSKYTLSWESDDEVSGLSHFEVKLDNGQWENVGTDTTYTSQDLTEGDHTFAVKAFDNAGNVNEKTLTATIEPAQGETPTPTTPPPQVTTPPGTTPSEEETPPWLIAAAIAVIAVAVAIIGFKLLKRPKKPPKPAQLRITAEPANLVADGKTKSVITLQLLDKKGKPINALTDTQVTISAAKGKLETSTLTVPKGKATEQTFIISSDETGEVPLKAEAEGLKGFTVTLNFLEKKRYCMHCGALMPDKGKACPNCGKLPPAGVDTKICHNCQSVIPTLAKFCSECGAGQKQ